MSLSKEYEKLTTESACGTGKHYSPFKCESVPADYLRTIVAKYPKLCEFVFWECTKNWMKESGLYVHAGHRLSINKKWWLHPLSVKLQAIIQRELNYEKSTFIAGHIYHRFGSIYRRMMGYSWAYQDAFGKNRKLVFYKNGIPVDSIYERDRTPK